MNAPHYQRHGVLIGSADMRTVSAAFISLPASAGHPWLGSEPATLAIHARRHVSAIGPVARMTLFSTTLDSPVLCISRHQPEMPDFAGLPILDGERSLNKLGKLAVLLPLCCAGNVYGTQSHVSRPFWQFIYAHEWKKFNKIGVTGRQNLCCVKDTLIAILASISDKYTNAELADSTWLRVRNPMTVLIRPRDAAPTPADMAFRRDQGVPFTKDVIGGLSNVFFKPIVNVASETLVDPSDAVLNVTGGYSPDIHASEFYKKSYFSFFDGIARANFANEFGVHCQPRSEVAFSNFPSVHQRLGHFLHGSFGSLGAHSSGFGRLASIVKGRNYEDDPNSSNPPCCASPEGLFLGSLSGAPFYAKLGLMLVLGGFAGVLINESEIRGFHNGNQGRLLLALGMGCLIGSFIAALLFA